MAPWVTCANPTTIGIFSNIEAFLCLVRIKAVSGHGEEETRVIPCEDPGNILKVDKARLIGAEMILIKFIPEELTNGLRDATKSLHVKTGMTDRFRDVPVYAGTGSRNRAM